MLQQFAAAYGMDPEILEHDLDGMYGNQPPPPRPTFDSTDLFDGKSEAEVYSYIIDGYRFRIEEEYTHTGEASGLYGGEDPMDDFLSYLQRAKQRGVLPSWWSKKKKKACVALARNMSGDSCIYHAVEKDDIQEKYKEEPFATFHLRALAEEIYGYEIGGYNGGSEDGDEDYGVGW